MKPKLLFPLYPILISVYPILALVAHNIREVDPWVGLRSILISATICIIGWGIVLVFYRNLQKSALFVSTAIGLFFTYGHVYRAIQTSALKSIFGHHRLLLGISVLIFLAVIWLLRKNPDLRNTTQALNIISGFLVISSLAQIISYQVSLQNAMKRNQNDFSVSPSSSQPELYPDVYYIILDSYTRADALTRDFDLDTTPYLDAMRARGFYVADCARSNYTFTELSMASAFNINYLDQLNPKILPGSQNLTLATALIKNNAVRRQFESEGYKIVAFETGYVWNYWEDADVFLADEANLFSAKDIQPFEYLLLDTTAFTAISDLNPGLPEKQDEPRHHARHVKRTNYQLEELAKLPDLGAPKFVYAHINVPHVPFIFKRDGSLLNNPDFYRGDQDYPISEEYFIAGYRNQVEFINQRILQTVDGIIQNSNTSPVIIIQGDHGIRGLNRSQILSLYLIPGGSEELYGSITPVNSFRVIFNKLFQKKLPLIEDHSYNSTHELPYDLEEVSENSTRCLAK